MRYLLAVSGGIDSVVLLDLLAARQGHELVVAHFDHGIREDSAADARFVEALAKKYHLPFVSKREELGKEASEELARTRRYEFLKEQAEKHKATIVTAHHSDDVIETIAINLQRGTGWRGLAVFDNEKIKRPLLHVTKGMIRAYARVKRLEWVEDSTNQETKYLRNQLRRRIALDVSEETKQKVLDLWERQVNLKAKIQKELETFRESDHIYSRYLLTYADQKSATELLRAIVYSEGGVRPTRPQVERALLAVKTARGGTKFELGSGVKLHFTPRTFVVQTP